MAPTPVLLPGKSHGQRSLVGCSPWGHYESDTTERLISDLISNFLEEMSNFSHSIVFLCFFAMITDKDFLISPCYSLELCFQIGISFIFSFAFSFFTQLFVRPPQTTILLFCISFSWGWSWFLPPVQCHEPPSIVHQALCLSDLIPWIYLSLPLYTHKDLI